MTEQEAIDKARSYFLTEDHVYGCAETTYVVLQEAFGLPNATDSSPAMVFNGGIAWRGGICGVIAGVAMAVGRLAEQRVVGHKNAKRVARRIVDRFIDEFQVIQASVDCRDLIGQDIHTDEQHNAFIESGIWRNVCMRQIEFAVGKLFALRDEQVWRQTVRAVECQEVSRPLTPVGLDCEVLTR
jgi:C_GCAxxG_C_C family probable redox protein